MSPTEVTVSAAANVALIKYWGKSGAAGNQPATGSLSIGLEDLRTTTTLRFSESGSDEIDADLDLAAKQRLIRFLDHARATFEFDRYFLVKTDNNFPTGAGLASSASGFAALALAVDAIEHLQLSKSDISRLARTGSGSAARSVYEGFAEVVPTDDAYAQQIIAAEAWPLDVIVAVTDPGPKAIGSTEAMASTAATSQFYQSWLDTHAADMREAKQAIGDRDFSKLADLAEGNCLKMHGTMMTSHPPILYWQPATLAIMHRVRELRGRGIPVFFTIDAGPQVKIVCEPDSTAIVHDALDIPGISQTIRTRVGGAPFIQLK